MSRVALHTELGSKEGMAVSYNNLGKVHVIRRELDEARRSFKLSAELYAFERQVK